MELALADLFCAKTAIIASICNLCPDGLSIELMEALEEYEIEKVTTLLNEIYDTGQIPIYMSRSIFIALPKKPGATDCELHRTISLMSHFTKLLLYHHDESKKQEKSRNSRRTMRFLWKEKEQLMPSSSLEL